MNHNYNLSRHLLSPFSGGQMTTKNSAKTYARSRSKTSKTRSKLNRAKSRSFSRHRSMTTKNERQLSSKRSGRMRMSSKREHISENLSNSSQCSDIYYCYMFNVHSTGSAQSSPFNSSRAFFKKLFGGFIHWKDAVPQKIKLLNSDSGNGFISDIPFENGKYTAHALLKSLKNSNSDNLLFEGIAGLCINDLCERFPIFIETYGIGNYTTGDCYFKLLYDKPVGFADLATIQMKSIRDIVVNSKLIRDTCISSGTQCVLIEKVESSIPMKAWLRSQSPDNLFFWNNQLLQCLFQIYSVLDSIKEKFTHYDLHTNNVMICKLKEPIVIRYYVGGKKLVEFVTDFVVKLIDYGRSFFDLRVSSLDVIRMVCQERECGNTCGSKKGFISRFSSLSQYFINSTVVNYSHDLRNLNIVLGEITKHHVHCVLAEWKPRMVYDAKTKKVENNHYGTAHVAKGQYPDAIVNVHDAYLLLLDLITHPEFVKINQSSASINNIKGILEIELTMNKPMQFHFL